MAFENTSPNTGETLEAQDAASLRLIWQKTIDMFEQQEDWYQKFESKREDSIIQTKSEVSVGAGHRMTFSSSSGFYHAPVHGSADFETSADYEKALINSNTLYVDWVRHGTRWDERMEEHMGIRHELVSGFAKEQGKWLGRFKSTAMSMCYREKGNSSNYVIVGASDRDSISGTNTLSWQAIVDAKPQLQRLGAKAAFMGKAGRNDIKRYMVGALPDSLNALETDDAYLEAQHHANVDGKDNVLFAGGWSDVRGNFICEFQDIDHDGDGPIGSPYNPKLFTNDAITPDTTVFDITGGDGAGNSNPKVPYTWSFPNHAFKFNEQDVLTAGTEDFFVLIVNPPDAPTDPGKMGMYRCVTNDGNKISIKNEAGDSAGAGGRLGAATSGVTSTQVGTVTWDTGVWSGLHTATHPAGALCVLVNAKGQPIGRTLISGACSARRGYGKFRNHRATGTHEGGFKSETYLWSVFGQVPRMRRDGKFPGYLLLEHAIHYAGTPIPTDIT